MANNIVDILILIVFVFGIVAIIYLLYKGGQKAVSFVKTKFNVSTETNNIPINTPQQTNPITDTP